MPYSIYITRKSTKYSTSSYGRGLMQVTSAVYCCFGNYYLWSKSRKTRCQIIIMTFRKIGKHWILAYLRYLLTAVGIQNKYIKIFLVFQIRTAKACHEYLAVWNKQKIIIISRVVASYIFVIFYCNEKCKCVQCRICLGTYKISRHVYKSVTYWMN